MLLEVGPVSSHAVLAWIDYAEAVLAAVADEPSGGADDESFDDYVPAEVYAQFATYLQDWRPIAESTDEFHWTIEVEPEVAEYLVHAFFKMSWHQARVPAEGLRMTSSAALFNRHLVKRMLGSLSGEGHAEAEFAEHLRSFWPGLDTE